MTTSKFSTSGHLWSRLSVAVLITAVVVVAMLYGRALLWHRPTASNGIELLADANQSTFFRMFEGRVSSRFGYKPRTPTVRGGENEAVPGHDNLRLLAAAAAVAAQAAENPTVENLYAQGVSYMLLGRPENAIETLTRALRDATGEAASMKAIGRCTDAALLNALAAACQMRFSEQDAGEIKATAVEAIHAAWRLQQVPEIAWTRAVVMESLHIREISRDAWRDFLAIEPSSPWSAEARNRLHALSQPTDSDVWPAASERLGSGRADPAALTDTVRRFPQQVRVWCEDELLPAWGDAALRGGSIADERLVLVGTIGRALARETGEESIALATQAIRNAPSAEKNRLARGHVAYGAGRKAMSSDATAALRSFEIAVAELDTSLTTFAYRAQAEHAASLYMLNDYAAALREFERLLDANAPERSGSTALKGRLHWAIGLLNLQTGHPSAAVVHYKVSLEAFDRSREKDHQAALHSLLADALESIGNPGDAARHRDAALQLLEKTGNVQRRHSVIFEAAYAAISKDQPALADLLLDRVVAHDLTAGTAVTACTSLMWRSAYRAKRAGLKGAEDDLRLARRTCTSIADTPVRERALANLGVAQAILGELGDRTPDLKELDAAIEYYERTESRVWLRTAHLTRARARANAGDLAAAEIDYRAAVAESLAARDEIDDRDVRMSFTATADEVNDAYVEFLLASGRAADAFEAADRSRARELVTSPSTRWFKEPWKGPVIGAVQASLPADARLIEYRVLESRIVAWIVGPGTFQTLTLPGSISEIAQHLEQLNGGASEARLRQAAGSLHAALIRPLQTHLREAGTLLFVPDDELERVPFAALYDTANDQYLADTTITSILPSAALFAPSGLRLAERTKQHDRVIVIEAGQARRGLGELWEAPEEAQGIALLFQDTRIITDVETSGAAILRLVHDATLLHFVGHAAAQLENETSGALLLGDSSALVPADVVDSSLSHVRIAYLSACDTDVGRILKAEGSATMARSFFAAGVPVVVATLWPVEDNIARQMAQLFYGHIRKGRDPAQALRMAQMSLSRKNSGTRADWAAYRIVGTGFMVTN